MVKMGYVWDRTVEFLGDHLSTLMPIVILCLFVPTSVLGALEDLRQGGGPGVKLVLGILSLGFSILSLWVQLAIAALAIDPAAGGRMTAVATARLLPAIGVLLCLMVAVVLLCLPIVAIVFASGLDFATAGAGGQMPAMPPGYGLAAFLYALALTIGLLFVGARLMPLTGVIVAERRGAGAISWAFRLTSGLTWRLVGVLILYGVVSIVATLAAQTVFGSILRIFAGGDGPITVASVITAIVVAAVSTALTVLGAAFTAKLYVSIVHAVGAPRASAGSVAAAQ